MPHEPIAPACRELLGKLRNLLLDQHKLLLELERAGYEQSHGPIAGPGAFLELVLGDPHFSWLRQLSSLVVEIDESLSRRSAAGQADADAILVKTREMLRPREAGRDFQRHYYGAIQQSPDVVILQCRLEQLLGI